MSSAVLVLLLGLLAFTWVRRNQRARRRWLARVSLAGSWSADHDAGRSVMEFTGGPGEGRYSESDGSTHEQGEWVLHGAHLTLTPDRGQPIDYEFRLFEDGSVGIDGPGRVRRVYARSATNVVPLRSRR